MVPLGSSNNTAAPVAPRFIVRTSTNSWRDDGGREGVGGREGEGEGEGEGGREREGEGAREQTEQG